MRMSRYLLTVALLASTGCSAFVASSGMEVAFDTRDEVHRALGEPTTAGIVQGQPYEEYVTHRKISERCKGEGIVLSDGCTLCLWEVISLPTELYLATHQILVGQTLRFTYDEQGYITGVLRNGEIDGACAGCRLRGTLEREQVSGDPCLPALPPDATR